MGDSPKHPETYAAVILAAGRSTRMGADNKLLLEVEPGVTVIRRTVEKAISAGLGPLFVVTGHQAEKVRAALAGLNCHFVHNPDFAKGLSGSIRAGFREAVRQGATGVVVLLGDMPFLPTEAVAAVLAKAANEPVRIVQAVHDGRPAHPVWLPRSAAGLLDRLEGDRGVRSIVTGDDTMVAVEVDADAIFDLDTPQDYLAAKKRATGSGN